VADESLATPYYRVSGSDSDYDTVYTTDTTAGGLCTQNDSSGNLVWGPHNELTYSEQFDNAAWTKTASAVTANTTTAPDGTTTADTIEESGSSGVSFVFQAFTVSEDNKHTLACALKAGTHDYAFISLSRSNSYYYGAAFDLSNGTSINTGSSGAPSNTSNSITSLGDGWYLCSISAELPGSVSAPRQRIGLCDASPTWSLGSASLSASSGQTIYAWGAHLYRSDLGGMADVPSDQRAVSSLPKYLRTTTAAKYLIRRRHYRYTGTSYVPTLLHEPVGATNSIPDSQPTSATWTETSASITSGTSAIGLPAATITSSSATGNVNQDAAANNTDTYASWALVKANSLSEVTLRCGKSGNYVQRTFDLSAETASSATTAGTGTDEGGGIIEFGSSIYLCWLAGSAIGNGSAVALTIWPGTTTTGTGSVDVFHAQVEDNAVPSSPIITTGASVTRSADTCKVKAAALPYDATNMSMAFAGRLASIASTVQPILSWGIGSNTLSLLKLAVGNVLQSLLVTSGSFANSDGGSIAAGASVGVKSAGRFVGSTAVQSALDGAANTADTSSVPALPAISGTDMQVLTDASRETNGEVDTLILWSDDIAQAGLESTTS
jgi:hypothetical protein